MSESTCASGPIFRSFGKAIAPGGVQRAAREAEQQGFDDVWVSDHLVNLREQSYPAPYISPERGDLETWLQGQAALANVLFDRA
jgi:alkanesulfonate monooxygenase SsuD/methylene tetrahydromethanopterin reductase-like flavin-dependent oxidoreductase (luciferase family)